MSKKPFISDDALSGRKKLFQKTEPSLDSQTAPDSSKQLETAKNSPRQAKYKDSALFKKCTYYLKREVEMDLQSISLKRGRDLSSLANEAIEDLIKKYKQEEEK